MLPAVGDPNPIRLTKRPTESARTVPWGGAPSLALRAAAKFREFSFHALGRIRGEGRSLTTASALATTLRLPTPHYECAPLIFCFLRRWSAGSPTPPPDQPERRAPEGGRVVGRQRPDIPKAQGCAHAPFDRYRRPLQAPARPC